MITVEINGIEYPVRYSLRALKKFEQQTKKSVFALGDTSQLSAEACAWLVYVGIADGAKFAGNEFDLKLAEIEGHIDLTHVEQCIGALQHGTQPQGKKKR